MTRLNSKKRISDVREANSNQQLQNSSSRGFLKNPNTINQASARANDHSQIKSASSTKQSKHQTMAVHGNNGALSTGMNFHNSNSAGATKVIPPSSLLKHE